MKMSVARLLSVDKERGEPVSRSGAGGADQAGAAAVVRLAAQTRRSGPREARRSSLPRAGPALFPSKERSERGPGPASPREKLPPSSSRWEPRSFAALSEWAFSIMNFTTAEAEAEADAEGRGGAVRGAAARATAALLSLCSRSAPPNRLRVT